jgi:putative membrane protein
VTPRGWRGPAGSGGARSATIRPVHPIAVVAAVLAALIHAWFFVLESLWFMRPAVWQRFGLASDAEARVTRSFAFNQGFYNLFLAIGVAIGLGLTVAGHGDAGRAIVLFACGSMVAAGLVLMLRNPAYLRAASIQAVPPLVAILAIVAFG